MIDAKKISINFQILKVFSILMVVAGHYFKEVGGLWVPVTVGSFIFAYSSAYFTTIKYGTQFDVKVYLKKKTSRILLE